MCGKFQGPLSMVRVWTGDILLSDKHSPTKQVKDWDKLNNHITGQETD